MYIYIHICKDICIYTRAHTNQTHFADPQVGKASSIGTVKMYVYIHVHTQIKHTLPSRRSGRPAASVQLSRGSVAWSAWATRTGRRRMCLSAGIGMSYQIWYMCACACICVCVCERERERERKRLFIYKCLYINICIYMYAYIHICTYTYIYIYVHICSYPHIHMYMYIQICICIYI